MNATAGVTEAPRIVTSVTNVSRKVTGTEGDFTTSLSVPGMHDADRLRLAIALTALRHKPAEQAYESYSLDLCSNFPLDCKLCCKRSADEDDSWRTRVVALEKELQALQDQHQSEHIELVALRAAPQTASDTPACPAPTPNTKEKKKQKKKVPQGPNPPAPTCASTLRLEGILSAATPNVQELSNPSKLFTSIQTLDLLVELRHSESSVGDDEMLCLVARRALGALSVTLASVFPPATASSSSSGVIDTVSTLLSRLITTVFPLLTARKRNGTGKPSYNDSIDTLVGCLVTSILVPVLRSLAPLSRSYLAGLFNSKEDKRSTSKFRSLNLSLDIRPDALNLLRNVLNTLQSLIPATTSTRSTSLITSIQTAHDCLTLEAIRELEKLYPPNLDCPCNVGETSASSPQTPDRLEKLVQKDALWYVCSIMHLTISGTNLAAPLHEAGLSLAEAICTALAALLRRTRPVVSHANAEQGLEGGDQRGLDGTVGKKRSVRGGLGEVERQMVLAVAERLWLSQG